mgnify:CR=1 FL=1
MTSSIDIDLGGLVKERRRIKGWSQTALSERLKASAEVGRTALVRVGKRTFEPNAVWVSKLENGEFRQPLPDKVVDVIATALEDDSRVNLYKQANRRTTLATTAEIPLKGIRSDNLLDVIRKHHGDLPPPRKSFFGAFMTSAPRASNDPKILLQLSELASAGVTVAFCLPYSTEQTTRRKFPSKYSLSEMQVDDQRSAVRRSMLTMVKSVLGKRKNSAGAGAVLLFEPKASAALAVVRPETVLESREVLVQFGTDTNVFDRLLVANVLSLKSENAEGSDELVAIIQYDGLGEPDHRHNLDVVHSTYLQFAELLKRWEQKAPKWDNLKRWKRVDDQEPTP